MEQTASNSASFSRSFQGDLAGRNREAMPVKGGIPTKLQNSRDLPESRTS